MKHPIALSLALALSMVIPAVGHAQMKGDRKGEGQIHNATGKVTKVDPAASSVTIAHEPVPSMKWPSMTMAFKVKDKAMLEKAKQGAKVDFSFTQSGKDYVITGIK